jgi:hypothetical protein
VDPEELPHPRCREELPLPHVDAEKELPRGLTRTAERSLGPRMRTPSARKEDEDGDDGRRSRMKGETI